MILGFGKHSEESVQKLLFSEPSYVEWILDQPEPRGRLKAARQEVLRLRAHMDGKPFKVHCAGCGGAASRASAYWNSDSLFFWCEDCDHYQLGANQGKLAIVRSYEDALRHAKFRCGDNEKIKKSVVKQLAQAKGLKSKLTAKALDEFFQ